MVKIAVVFVSCPPLSAFRYLLPSTPPSRPLPANWPLLHHHG